MGSRTAGRKTWFTTPNRVVFAYARLYILIHGYFNQILSHEKALLGPTGRKSLVSVFVYCCCFAYLVACGAYDRPSNDLGGIHSCCWEKIASVSCRRGSLHSPIIEYRLLGSRRCIPSYTLAGRRGFLTVWLMPSGIGRTALKDRAAYRAGRCAERGCHCVAPEACWYDRAPCVKSRLSGSERRHSWALIAW